MDVTERRRAADALRSIRRGGEGWYSLSDAVLGGPAPRDEVVARLADLIDPGEDTTVSAYDLLSKEERRALNRWPRFDDGAPVWFGDEFIDHQGIVRSVFRIDMCQEGGFFLYTGQGTKDWHSAGEPVKRPAVPAADGEPLEVGQTVWGVSNGIEFTVVGLPKSGEYQAVKLLLDDGAFTGLDPDQLTHKRPVLDADGVPCKEGDTVYALCDGSEHVVECVNEDGTLKSAKLNSACYLVASRCTHTKPEPADDWESIEEESQLDPCEYFDHMAGSCHDCPGGPEDSCGAHFMADIVRRSKKLAGVASDGE